MPQTQETLERIGGAIRASGAALGAPLSLPAIDVTRKDDIISLDELREECRARMTRMFAEALPAAVQSIVGLSREAEDEGVKLRASAQIVKQFELQANAKPLPHTNIQIVNAIPFQREAFVSGLPAQTVTIDNARIAMPIQASRKFVKPKGEEEIRVKTSFFKGGKAVLSEAMSKIGPPTDRPNDEVVIKKRPG